MRMLALGITVAVATTTASAWAQDQAVPPAPMNGSTSPASPPTTASPTTASPTIPSGAAQPAPPSAAPAPQPIVVNVIAPHEHAPTVEMLRAARLAREEDEREAHAEANRAAETEKRRQRLRLGLGVEFQGFNGVSTGSTLGGIMPNGVVELEARMIGPLWCVTHLDAGYQSNASSVNADADGKSWNVGGALGLRVEVATFRWLDLGGHVMLYGDHEEYHSTPTSSVANRVGSTLGADVHFRPTRFFGVRMGIDVADLDYLRQVNDAPGLPTDIETGFGASLKLRPTLMATLSF